MATTIQEQVEVLLGRRLTEEKSSDVSASELEAAAVIETMAMTLYLYPRVALYFAHLARNGLAQVVSEELDQLAELQSLINDLGNQSFSIRDTSALTRARNSLLQLEKADAVTSESAGLTHFESSVDEFLEKQLSKNVRRKGSTSVVRPSVEAQKLLPDAFTSLKTLHADLIDRMSSLLAGIPAFDASQGSGIIASNTAYRVREDIEAIIEELANDPAASNSSDYLTRLMASKAALQMLSTPPSWRTPLIDTLSGTPDDSALQFSTAGATSRLVINLPDNSFHGLVTVSTPDGAAAAEFPAGSFNTTNRAFLYGEAVTWPVLVPAGQQLFLRFDTTLVRVALNTTAIPSLMTLADVKSAITTAAGGLISVSDYRSPSSGRLLLIASSAVSELEVLSSMSQVVGGVRVLFTNSAAPTLGLSYGMATKTSVSQAAAADFFEQWLGLGLTVVKAVDGTVVLEHGPADLSSVSVTGMPAPWTAGAAAGQAARGRLFGTLRATSYPNTDGGAIPPADLLGIGDELYVGGNSSRIQGFFDRQLEYAPALPSTAGAAVLVRSALTELWEGLQRTLSAFQGSWTTAGFASGLERVDRALAPLAGAPSPARRGAALEVLQLLEVQLEALQDVLALYPLEEGAGEAERSIGDSLVAMVRERKLDRALDYLLRCKLTQVFSMDWQTASYAGEMMSALSGIASSDLSWPNLSLEDVSGAHAENDLGGIE